MKSNKLLRCLLLLFAFSSVFAANPPAATTTKTPTQSPQKNITPAVSIANDAAATQQLVKLMNGFESMQANFNQSVYDSDGYLMQRSSGQMALQRPGKFRWQITKPSQQLLLADGTTVWIYNVALQQVTKQTLSGRKASDPATLLSGSVDSMQQRFNTNFLNNKNSNAGTWFQLVPKAKDDMFKWIQLHFSNNQLDQMKLADNLGQVSVFKFNNIKTNTNIDPQLFVFKVPKGVDVISSASSSNDNGVTTTKPIKKHLKHIKKKKHK